MAKDALIQEIQLLNATAPVGQGREADAGAVAAIDVKTGEVLGCPSSWPDYHLTTYNQDFSDLLRMSGTPCSTGADGEVHPWLHLQAHGSHRRPG